MENQNAEPESNEEQKEQKSYQEIKEERQKKNEESRRVQQQKGTISKIKYTIIILSVLGIVGYGVYTLVRNSIPDGTDYSRAVPLLEAGHIAEGSPVPEYNSNPPSSGLHYPRTARSDFRTETIPDQYIVHNLEHGDIWIAYHPRISDELKDQLKKITGTKVIITPREANDTDIALVAWGRIDTFDVEKNTLPIKRIEEFITRYANKGPERIPGKSQGI
jgi:hypothetical protein